MATNTGIPTGPEEFGRELRRLRESAGLSLDDIAAETKISPRILRSLEEGRFEHLPEKVFSRNFVRQYGRTIAMDDERLVEAFEVAWERFEEKSGSHPAMLVLPPEPRHSIRWGLVVPAVLAAIALVIAAVVIWRTWKRPPEVPGLARSVTPTAVRVPPTPVVTPEVPTVVAEIPPAKPTEAPEEGIVSFSISVKPLAECWFRFRDATGKTARELVGGGSTRSFKLTSPVRLTLGNAGAVSVEVSGRQYTGLGKDGQVVHVEVTPEGLRKLRPGSNDG